jgi:signal transduction histidine kinase
MQTTDSDELLKPYYFVGDGNKKTPRATDTDKYYEAVFHRFENGGNLIEWNWAAALVGPFWPVYRRMYVVGILFSLALKIIGAVIFILLGNSLANLVTEVDPWTLSISTIIIFLPFWIFLGLFGNFIYYHSILRKIRLNIKPTFSSPVESIGVIAVLAFVSSLVTRFTFLNIVLFAFCCIRMLQDEMQKKQKATMTAATK